MLNEEDWEILEKHFGRLLHFTALRINGDRVVCERADLVQDLRLTVLVAVSSFLNLLEREHDEDLTFREVWEDDDSYYKVQLIKYIKTCIFNCKNKKGARITARMDMGNKTIQMSVLEKWQSDRDHNAVERKSSTLEIIDPRSYHAHSELALEDFQYTLSDVGSAIVDHVINGDVLSEDGKVIRVKLAKKLKLSTYEVSRELDKIENILESNYGAQKKDKEKASYGT